MKSSTLKRDAMSLMALIVQKVCIYPWCWAWHVLIIRTCGRWLDIRKRFSERASCICTRCRETHNQLWQPQYVTVCIWRGSSGRNSSIAAVISACWRGWNCSVLRQCKPSVARYWCQAPIALYGWGKAPWISHSVFKSAREPARGTGFLRQAWIYWLWWTHPLPLAWKIDGRYSIYDSKETALNRAWIKTFDYPSIALMASHNHDHGSDSLMS